MSICKSWYDFPLSHVSRLSSSKIAIKMSRASSKVKDLDDAKTESVASSDDEDEDLDHPGREETPDLYRNSALGM